MKILLPIIILLAGGIIGYFQFVLKSEPTIVAPERPITSVEVITVQPETIQLTVKSQGTLLPATETDLTAEVSGRIIEVADNFRVGNSFRKGDTLITIDPADYKAVAAARAAELANAELALAQEEALAAQAAADWEALGEGDASPLTLRTPQLKQAKALLESAQAALAKAERDLDRTAIKAPYDGTVLTKNVDIGQYLTANPANPIARIYATNSAEIRLPITEADANFLDHRTKRQRFVTLTLPNGNSSEKWQARLARIESNINPNSRLLYVVAELPKPFTESSKSTALRRGTFMEAEIEGRAVQDVYSLPRYALRGSNTVYIYTDENTLITRTVEILKSDAKQVIISTGLNPGERVAISPIAYYIEGMDVSIVNETITETGARTSVSAQVMQ
ncbi:MAG: efflux RND transporter periplasmic adaptor subunit [Opitutaceae bacterium]